MQSQTKHFKPSNLQGVWRERYEIQSAQRNLDLAMHQAKRARKNNGIIARQQEAAKDAENIAAHWALVSTAKTSKTSKKSTNPELDSRPHANKHCEQNEAMQSFQFVSVCALAVTGAMAHCDIDTKSSDEVTVYFGGNNALLKVNVARIVNLENLKKQLSKKLNLPIPDYGHMTCNDSYLQDNDILRNGDKLAFTCHGRGGARTRLRIDSWDTDFGENLFFNCTCGNKKVKRSPSFKNFGEEHMNQFFGSDSMGKPEELQKFGAALCPQEIWEQLEYEQFERNGSKLEVKDRKTLVAALKDYWIKLQNGEGDAHLHQSSELAVIKIEAHEQESDGFFFYGKTGDQKTKKLSYDYKWSREMMRTYLESFPSIEKIKEFCTAFFIEDHGFSEEAIKLATVLRKDRSKKSKKQWIGCAVEAWSRQELVFHVNRYQLPPIKVTTKNGEEWETNDLYIKKGPGPNGKKTTAYVVLHDGEAYEGLGDRAYLDLKSRKLIVTDPEEEEDEEIKYELLDGGSIAAIIDAKAPVSPASSPSSHTTEKSESESEEPKQPEEPRYTLVPGPFKPAAGYQAFHSTTGVVAIGNGKFRCRFRKTPNGSLVTGLCTEEVFKAKFDLNSITKLEKEKAHPTTNLQKLPAAKPPASPHSNTPDGAAREAVKHDPPNDAYDRPRLMALYQTANPSMVKNIEAIMAERPRGEDRVFMWRELSIRYPRFFRKHRGFPAILPKAQVAKEASIEKSPTPSVHKISNMQFDPITEREGANSQAAGGQDVTPIASPATLNAGGFIEDDGSQPKSEMLVSPDQATPMDVNLEQMQGHKQENGNNGLHLLCVNMISKDNEDKCRATYVHWGKKYNIVIPDTDDEEEKKKYFRCFNEYSVFLALHKADQFCFDVIFWHWPRILEEILTNQNEFLLSYNPNGHFQKTKLHVTVSSGRKKATQKLFARDIVWTCDRESLLTLKTYLAARFENDSDEQNKAIDDYLALVRKIWGGDTAEALRDGTLAPRQPRMQLQQIRSAAKEGDCQRSNPHTNVDPEYFGPQSEPTSPSRKSESLFAEPGIHRGEHEPKTPPPPPEHLVDNVQKAAEGGNPKARKALNDIAHEIGSSPIFSESDFHNAAEMETQAKKKQKVDQPEYMALDDMSSPQQAITYVSNVSRKRKDREELNAAHAARTSPILPTHIFEFGTPTKLPRKEVGDMSSTELKERFDAVEENKDLFQRALHESEEEAARLKKEVDERNVKQEAATKIQVVARMWMARRWHQHLAAERKAAELAAIKIQAIARRRMARKLRQQLATELAATRIQAIARMQMACMSYQNNLPAWKQMQAAIKLANEAEQAAKEAASRAKHLRQEADRAASMCEKLKGA